MQHPPPALFSPPGRVIDLTSPTEDNPAHPDRADPLSSLPALASSIDTFAADIPGFLNALLSPLLPSELSVPPPKPPNDAEGADIFGIPLDLVPLDRELNELLTKLSLLSQDTSSSLEQSIHDVARTVPRLTYDLQFMRESATSLQTSLALVQGRVARQANLDPTPAGGAESNELKTNRSLEKLTHLDQLKSRMESARDILREAESWSTLEGEIMGFISSQEWERAGERLAEASRSLVVFQTTPGEYETKRTLLVSLQNELETALSVALKESLGSNGVEQIAKFHDIFDLMERGQEFRNYYFASRRQAVVDEWSGVLLLDAIQTEPVSGVEEGSGQPVKFSVFLAQFYSTFLTAIQSERAQVPLIFPPDLAQIILSTFVHSTLDALSPSVQSRLGAVADFYGAEAFPELIRAYKSTEELGVSIQSVLDKVAFNTQGDQSSGSPFVSSPSTTTPGTLDTAKAIATSSRRNTLSRRLSRTPGSVSETSTTAPLAWELALYEPFLDSQTSYTALEKRYLAHQLQFDPAFTTVSSRSTKDDAARVLWERSVTVFGMAEDAIDRCLAFTHGFGISGLVEALNVFLQSFLESNQIAVLDMAGKSAGTKSSVADELDFDGLDYSTEDWGAFQLGLHVLKTCRDVGDRLWAFERKLHASVRDITRIIKLDAQDLSAQSLTNATIGAITLLQQSPLNSAGLNELVTSYSSSRAVPLSSAHQSLQNFAAATQVFLQNIILSPLRAQLQAYPRLSVWSQPDKASKRGELHIPTFSLGPTDTIARVSEGLLNLLRVFEVYAADDAMSFSIETLPFVDADSIKAMMDPASDPASKVLPDEPPSPSSSPSHPAARLNGTSAEIKEGANQLNAETVLSTWVSSLSLSLLSHLTSTVLPSIRTLSTAGAAQLESDLGYLSNAVRALDVEWEELERWREAVGFRDEGAWKGRLKEVRGEGGDDAVLRRVGGARGWSVVG